MACSSAGPIPFELGDQDQEQPSQWTSSPSPRSTLGPTKTIAKVPVQSSPSPKKLDEFACKMFAYCASSSRIYCQNCKILLCCACANMLHSPDTDHVLVDLNEPICVECGARARVHYDEQLFCFSCISAATLPHFERISVIQPVRTPFFVRLSLTYSFITGDLRQRDWQIIS